MTTNPQPNEDGLEGPMPQFIIDVHYHCRKVIQLLTCEMAINYQSQENIPYDEYIKKRDELNFLHAVLTDICLGIRHDRRVHYYMRYSQVLHDIMTAIKQTESDPPK